LSLPETMESNPVFTEVWQAQAFALAVELSRRGHFTWQEWSATLGEELRGPSDNGSHYYHSWVRALERLVIAKGLLS
jgi:nitrile hydratase accessory protein